MKPPNTVLPALLLLLVLPAVVFAATPATNITTCPFSITTSGTYVLGAQVTCTSSNGLSVGANINVVINGLGNTLLCSGACANGVSASSATNTSLTIVGLYVKGFGVGITVTGVSKLNISNSLVTGISTTTAVYGIYVNGVVGSSSITDTTVQSYYSNAVASAYGIYVGTVSKSNVLTGNYVSDISGWESVGIYTYGNTAIVTINKVNNIGGNSLTVNSGYDWPVAAGMRIFGCTNSVVMNNQISLINGRIPPANQGAPMVFPGHALGIMVNSSTGVILKSNTITSITAGDGGNNNSADGAYGYGISVDGGSGNTIADSTINNVKAGSATECRAYSCVTANAYDDGSSGEPSNSRFFSGLAFGISVTDTGFSSISGNTVTGVVGGNGPVCTPGSSPCLCLFDKDVVKAVYGIYVKSAASITNNYVSTVTGGWGRDGSGSTAVLYGATGGHAYGIAFMGSTGFTFTGNKVTTITGGTGGTCQGGGAGGDGGSSFGIYAPSMSATTVTYTYYNNTIQNLVVGALGSYTDQYGTHAGTNGRSYYIGYNQAVSPGIVCWPAGVGCCSSSNTPITSSSTMCMAASGDCTTATYCNGVNDVCTTTYLPFNSTCRASAGICDPAEICDGKSANCPANTLYNSSRLCRASAGLCDAEEYCLGNSSSCPADARASTTKVCRAKAGLCDIEEKCNGVNITCPNDVVQPSNYTCRASAGVCDVPEICNGVSVTCPSDNKSTNYTCRISAGDCDVAETCNGVNASCPPDTLLPSSYVCRPSTDLCDSAETCNGVNVTCPDDLMQPSSYSCRPSAGVCDIEELCDGVGSTCPDDVVQPTTSTCRESAGVCDVAELCDGTGAACPADVFLSTDVICHNSTNICDRQQACTGDNPTCPSYTVKPLDRCGVCGGNNNTCSPCGDGKCDASRGENCVTCPSDCGAGPCGKCGDKVCQFNFNETCKSCPEDCGVCANATCPGKPECSGLGSCNNGLCVCVAGWSGPDCNSKAQPITVIIDSRSQPSIIITPHQPTSTTAAATTAATAATTSKPGTSASSTAASTAATTTGTTSTKPTTTTTTTTTTGSNTATTNTTANSTAATTATATTTDSFELSVAKFRELTANGTVVTESKFRNDTVWMWSPVKAANNSKSSSNEQWVFKGVLTNGVSITVYAWHFYNDSSFVFANQSTTIIANTVKFSVEVSAWPFKSVQNTLGIVFSGYNANNNNNNVGTTTTTTTTTTDLCGNEVKSTGTDDSGSVRWTRVNPPDSSSQLYATFFPYAVVDGRNRLITFSDLGMGQVEAVLPFFWTTAIVDPNYSLLFLSGDDKTDCAVAIVDDEKANGVDVKVVAPVVAGVGAAAAIFGITWYAIIRRNEKLRNSRMSGKTTARA